MSIQFLSVLFLKMTLKEMKTEEALVSLSPCVNTSPDLVRSPQPEQVDQASQGNVNKT